jgi:hypothetical protein
MGYASDFMAHTLTAVADFQKDLTTIVHLFGDDSGKLVSIAHTIHGTDFEGDTAQALVGFATTYQQLVQQNLDPINSVAKACATFHDEIQSASTTFDAAMPPGSNEVVDVVFSHEMFTPLDILGAYYVYSYYYNADPITPSVDKAYQIVIAQAEKNQVPQSMMYEYETIRENALSHLQTWCQAVAQAHTYWGDAIASNGTGDIPPLAAIRGITVNPGEIKSIENDFDMIGAPYGVAYNQLSATDQSNAQLLYDTYKYDDAGLSLAFIEALMAQGVSPDQISYMLAVWNTINWGKVALVAYYSAELLATITGIAQLKTPDPANTPEDPYIRITETYKPPATSGDAPPIPPEVVYRGPLADGGSIVYYKDGSFQIFKPGQELPPGAKNAPPPPLGQKWQDTIDNTPGGTTDNGPGKTDGSDGTDGTDGGDPVDPGDLFPVE